MRTVSLSACWVILLLSPTALAQTGLELVQATYFGTAADDDIQGAAPASDGSFYIVGNTGESMRSPPSGAMPARFGTDAANPQCGHGFVARISADGMKVLAYAEFGRGIVSATTVQVNSRGVYLAGYATEHLAPLLANVPGLVRQYPLKRDANPLQANNPNEAPGIPRNATTAPTLIQPKATGAPFVLRLSADLKTIQCGTYLEGWQQVWPKARNIGRKLVWPVEKSFPGQTRWQCWPTEYTWQPTHVGLLKSGDLVVCHDGGYSRELTDAGRKLAATIADPAEAKKLLGRLVFYDVCDYLSRLSPDLDKRTWRKDIYAPTIDLETIKRLKPGWPHPHYSNPRTHAMKLDKNDTIYLGGWSASATSSESYWTPYLWKVKPEDGSVVWKAYEYDPMSGGGNRMGGQVADTAVFALAVDNDSNILASLLSDGGNNVMGWSPRAVLGEKFEGEAAGGAGYHVSGVAHFHGQIHRFAADTRVGLRRTRVGPIGWLIDLAATSDNGVLALGRSNYDFEWSDDAWQKGDKTENPTAWLRLYSPKLELLFSTAMRGVVPFSITRLSPERFLIVGQSAGTLYRLALNETDKTFEVKAEPNGGLASTKNAMFAKPAGNGDGYWMIVECRPPRQ
jgi:hypothetical protein